jgi:hypothetical protein
MNQMVKTLKGMRQTKNERTTVPSIRTTCFLARVLLLSKSLTAEVTGLAIRWRAIAAYNTMRTSSGTRKNTEMVMMKKNVGQNVLTSVRQAGTRESSRYSRNSSYWAISRIGLAVGQKHKYLGKIVPF